MIVEIQITEEKFIQVIENRLRLIPICLTSKFTFDDELCIVDRVWPPGGGSLKRDEELTQLSWVSFKSDGVPEIPVPADQLQVSIPVNIYIRKVSDVQNPESDFSKYFQAIQLSLIANLNVSGTKFCLEYYDIESPIKTSLEEHHPDVLAKITTALKKYAKACGTISLESLTSLLGSLSITTTGLSANSDLSVLALRVEIDGPAHFDWDTWHTWFTFHHGAIHDQPLDEAQDWSLFIDKDLLLNSFNARFTDEMAKAEEEYLADPDAAEADGKKRVHVNEGPTSVWVPDGTGQIVVSFGATVFDVCPLTEQDIGIHVDVTADLALKNGKLSVHSSIAWGLVDSDVLLCFLEWGPGGAMALPMSRAIAEAFLTKEDIPAPAPECVTLDKETIECTFEVGLPPLKVGTPHALGTFDLASLTALDAGPVLQGTLDVLTIGAPTAGMHFTGWSWEVIGSCSSLHVGVSGGLVLGGSQFPSQPAKVCKWIEVIEDRPANFPQQDPPIPNMFNPQAVYGSTWMPIAVVPFDMTAADLLGEGPDDPSVHPWVKQYYPIRMVLRTNAGARCIVIPPLPALREGQLEQLELDKIVAMANCKAEQTGLLGIPGKFDPHWLPDPPQDLNAAHLWQIVLAGAGPEQRVAVEAAGERIATATGRIDKVIHWGAIIHPQGLKTELRVIHEPSTKALGFIEPSMASEPRAREELQIHVKQVLLIERAALDFDTPCLHLTIAGFPDWPALACVDRMGGVHLYEISIPAMPARVETFREAGVSGTAFWNGGLLTWGRQGVSFLPVRQRAARSRSRRVTSDATIDVVQYNRYFYSLTEAGIDVYDSEFNCVNTVQLQDAHNLEITGETLVVSDEHGIRLFNLVQPAIPRESGFHHLEGAAGLARPRIIGAGKAIFVSTGESGGVLLDISDPREVSEITRYFTEPWFKNCAQFGGVVAQLHRNRKSVSLYTVYKTVTSSYGPSRS
jgi:hypothetical protein